LKHEYDNLKWKTDPQSQFKIKLILKKKDKLQGEWKSRYLKINPDQERKSINKLNNSNQKQKQNTNSGGASQKTPEEMSENTPPQSKIKTPRTSTEETQKSDPESESQKVESYDVNQTTDSCKINIAHHQNVPLNKRNSPKSNPSKINFDHHQNVPLKERNSPMQFSTKNKQDVENTKPCETSQHHEKVQKELQRHISRTNQERNLAQKSEKIDQYEEKIPERNLDQEYKNLSKNENSEKTKISPKTKFKEKAKLEESEDEYDWTKF